MSYRYDVALSFSGKDRDAARELAKELQRLGLNVFYDEWEQAEIWGKDLEAHLREIFLAQARFCVPIFSESYGISRWTAEELRAAKERASSSKIDYILPVRLDDMETIHLPTNLASVDFRELGASKIAELLKQKLELPTERLLAADYRSSASADEPLLPVPIAGFKRHLISGLPKIGNHELDLDLDAINGEASPRVRWRSARVLRRSLAAVWVSHERGGLGPTYTLWRSGDRVYLSTLPGMRSVMDPYQKTIEFQILADRRLAARALWSSDVEHWKAISVDEYHTGMARLAADRAGIDIFREAVLRILELRGAKLGFPVSPQPCAPEKFCDWQTLPTDESHWDWERDPRLSDPIYDEFLREHAPSGVGLYLLRAQGAWPNRSLYALEDALEVLVPGRFVVEAVEHGLLHMTVLVSKGRPDNQRNAQQAQGRTTPDDIRDLDFVRGIVDRARAAVARMIAAMIGLPVQPPDVEPVPEPEAEVIDQFRIARYALGKEDSFPPRASDPYADGILSSFGETDWVELNRGMNAAAMLWDREVLAQAIPWAGDEIPSFIQTCEQTPLIDVEAVLTRQMELERLSASIGAVGHEEPKRREDSLPSEEEVIVAARRLADGDQTPIQVAEGIMLGRPLRVPLRANHLIFESDAKTLRQLLEQDGPGGAIDRALDRFEGEKGFVDIDHRAEHAAEIVRAIMPEVVELSDGETSATALAFLAVVMSRVTVRSFVTTRGRVGMCRSCSSTNTLVSKDGTYSCSFCGTRVDSDDLRSGGLS